MPFITTPEAFGIEKGLLQAVEDALQVRFGEEGVKLLPEIKALDDAEKYRMVHKAILKAITLDDVRRGIAEAAAPPPPKKRSAKRKPS